MVTDISYSTPPEVVENRIDQLSDQQISEVMSGVTVIGGKELLEAQLYSSILDHTVALNNILRYYTIDTLGFSPQDSMTIYLQNSDYL